MNIKILNLNMMHGRNTKTPVWPVFIPKEKVIANIEAIAELIKRYDPDIVTLQEVDRNSFSNGRVDELKVLNAILGYPHTAYGAHFHTPFATFGTAILSKFPLHNTKSHRFPVAFPTPRKGYLLTEVEVTPGRRVLLSSLHTTWINILYPDTRSVQLQHLIKNVLLRHEMPMIMSGDFNDTIHHSPNSRIEDFIDRLQLRTYEPFSHELSTFPSDNPKNRIDWIMVSSHFEFVTYESPQELLSDHLPIYAEVTLLD